MKMEEPLEINPEIAKTLLVEGATCVCIGVPPGSDFGIDMKSWTTGDKFLGIKMIPPGIHYIHYSATNKYGDLTPRTGFIQDFKKREVLVKKWNSECELLQNVDVETSQRVKENLKGLDSSLGAYPYEVWEAWKALSTKVTTSLVAKFTPACGNICSALELHGTANSQPARRKPRFCFFTERPDDELLPHLQAAEGTEIRFSKIPLQSYPEGASPSEITQHSLDGSYLLEQILIQHQVPADILGEIQFAFICFLVGQSLEAFEHWKQLVGICCASDAAISRHRIIFDELLTILHYQIQQVPQDFLVDIVASQNFVYQALRTLFRNIECNNLDGRLKSKCKRFQQALTEKFSWDFNDILEEEEEDLPVIVS